jgi:predicted 2-oxoglutarate/Fe(II)-dependent dioxygenase YbiX
MALISGEPAPLFNAPSKINPDFAFSTVAGRYILLAFLPPPGPQREAALDLVRARLGSFDDNARLFFGVLPDRDSFEAAPAEPPLRWFLDADGAIARRYERLDDAGELIPGWAIIDPSLRLMGMAPLERGADVLELFAGFGPPEQHAGVGLLHAPVLIVPRIFEPPLCQALVAAYADEGGAVSGVMRARAGRTFGVVDDFKRRRDVTLPDGPLKEQVRLRLLRRLVPEIAKAFSFKATRVERWTIACYSAEEGGWFRAHRDNGTPGTAHRKFACSINLNADFQGGDLMFPEFGWRRYRPPLGGAVVFGCGLLHEVIPVTEGVRYAYLPFFYDDEGARIRAENMGTFADDVDAIGAGAAAGEAPAAG